jgi:hypothetical protein
MEFKTCYVISFWLGERRRGVERSKIDPLYLLKKQIEILQTVKHSVNTIILNFNLEVDQYQYIGEIFKLVPKSIQGSDIVINIRENYGISYGAWSDIFEKYKSEYDYYIFSEDDYFFIEDNWDDYLIRKHNSYDDCGYLCMVIREPHSWNDYRKIAGSSVGIASSENLMKVFKQKGRLPSIKKEDHINGDAYTLSQDIQNMFGYAFIELGLNIYDVRDDYRVMFSKGGPPHIQNKIDVWLFFNWNQKYISVSAEYFNETYHYYDCFDLEFLKGYAPTTPSEAKFCFDHKLYYFDEDGSGSWVRRIYPEGV